METAKVLCLSTAHLSKDSRYINNEWKSVKKMDCISIQPADFGLIVYLCRDIHPSSISEKCKKAGLPADFANCLCFAYDMGCSQIIFDSDVEPLPYLPQYHDEKAVFEITLYALCTIQDGNTKEELPVIFQSEETVIWLDHRLLNNVKDVIRTYIRNIRPDALIQDIKFLSKTEYQNIQLGTDKTITLAW